MLASPKPKDGEPEANRWPDGGEPGASPGLDNGEALRLHLRLDEALEQVERWRSEAERAKVEAAALRAERDAAREVVRVLQEQVTWLRRPWWRRLVGG